MKYLLPSSDPNAIHDDTEGEIFVIGGKGAPAANDVFLIEDSADSYAKKKVLWSALPGAGGGEANTGSNQGTDGVGVYDTKVGVDLQFRHVAPGSSKMTASLNGKDIDIDVVEANFVHDHDGATGGGTVEGTSIGSSGEAGGTKFLREDGDGTCSWQTPAGGAPEGTAVLSTGEVGGTKFLREDGDGTCSWQAVAGGGDVTKVGTPVAEQVGVWTGDGTLKGDPGFIFTAANGYLGVGAAAPTADIDIYKNQARFAIRTIWDNHDAWTRYIAGTQTLDIRQWGENKTGTYFGLTRAGMTEFISIGGICLVGTSNAQDVVLGTNSTPALTIDGTTQAITPAGTVDGRDVATDGSKLDGIEAAADVTDAANVDAAGATMNADTDVKANGWVVDEDDMVSNLDTKVPTQQSVKTYVDAVAGSATTQVVATVRNATGVTLSEGAAVYMTGAETAGVPHVALAQADSAATMPAYGIVDADISNNSNGTVIISGIKTGFNTSSFSVGDALYVSAATPGALTTTKPTGANLIQKVCQVTKDNPAVGAVAVFGAGRSNDIPNFTAADKFWYGGTSGVATEGDITAFGRSIIDDADAGTVRTTLGLVIGTDVQAHDSVLDNTTASYTTAEETKLSGIETAADVTDTTNVTAAGALMDSEVDADIKTLALPANTTISAFGATLVDDATATAARTTLGLTKEMRFTVQTPTSSELVVLGSVDKDCTIVEVHAWTTGTTPSTTWNLEKGTTAGSGGTKVWVADEVATTATLDKITSFTSDNLDADNVLWLTTSATSGTVTNFTVSVFLTED